MGLFGRKKKDEYDYIYDNGDDSGIDYSDLDENDDVESLIDGIRGSIGKGPCMYCGAQDGMKYEGNICFICSECGMSTHEDIYYRWHLGYPIEFED